MRQIEISNNIKLPKRLTKRKEKLPLTIEISGEEKDVYDMLDYLSNYVIYADEEVYVYLSIEGEFCAMVEIEGNYSKVGSANAIKKK